MLGFRDGMTDEEAILMYWLIMERVMEGILQGFQSLDLVFSRN